MHIYDKNCHGESKEDPPVFCHYGHNLAWHYVGYDRNFADDTGRRFFACEKDGEAACRFLHLFDPEHRLHLKQSLRELWWCEIYENDERREEEYAIQMQPSLDEV